MSSIISEKITKSAPLFEGFHEDIKNAEESLETDLQSLYDDIVGSGPEVIVPKPMSVLTASEAEPAKIALSDPQVPEDGAASSLDDLWMNPEDYYDEEIPVVSLDEDEPDVYEISEPEIAEEEIPEKIETGADAAKDDIFSMIDMLKADSDGETGFGDILSEIEANEGIATVDAELSVAAGLVTDPAAYEANDSVWDIPEEEPDEEVVIIPDTDEEIKPESVSFVDTDSDEFQRELAMLLGDEVPEEKPETPAGFVIDVPDDGNDYEAAAAQPEKLYITLAEVKKLDDEIVEAFKDSGKTFTPDWVKNFEGFVTALIASSDQPSLGASLFRFTTGSSSTSSWTSKLPRL